MLSFKRIASAILFFCVTGNVSAQIEFADPNAYDLPFFYLDIFNTRSQDLEKSRLDIYIKTPYNELQFVKLNPDSFVAKYEISIMLIDEDDFQTDSEVLQRSLTVSTFEETNTQGVYDDTETAFDVEPGKYKLIIGVMDKETKQTVTQKTKIEVRDFYEPKISISDVLIADSVQVMENGDVIAYPHVNLPRDQSTRVLGYFQVYTRKNKGKLNAEISIRNARNKKVFEDNRDFELKSHETPIVFEIPEGELSHGVYKLKIKAKAGKDKTDLETTFNIFSRGVPLTASDLESAIEQLRYIASNKERKKVENAPPDSQRAAFLKFWKKHDPSPGTEENELMAEFYRRVAYANKNFGRFQEGWKSDRGMVYIVLGEPNDIEREAYNARYRTSYTSSRPIKAFELWHYYKYNRTFVFIDESGFGEYRLENPVSINDLINLSF